MPQNKPSLEQYRAQIDAIDNNILELLAKRVEVVRNVGKLKNTAGTRRSIIRPGREAEMVRRVAAQKEHDIPNAAALAQLWRLIIASAINIEEKPKVATVSSETNRECYWLAREYFGNFTPMVEKATVAEVLQDVMEGRATTAVVPLFGREGPTSWWSRIEDNGEEAMPKIFAKLPFIQFAPSVKEPLVVLGYVEPEETGNDESLWVIRADEKLPFSALEQALKEAKLNYAHLETCRVLGVTTTHHYLLKFSGFIDRKSKKLSALAAKLNDVHPRLAVKASAHYLGSYAVPIFFGEAG